MPAGKRILVGGKAVDTNRPLPLLVAGGEIKITCVGDNPETPTVWSQITQTLVKPTLEAIDVESRIHLSSHSDSGLSAETELPVTASKLEIEGPDLQPTQIGMSGSGHRTIPLTGRPPASLIGTSSFVISSPTPSLVALGKLKIRVSVKN